MSDKRKLSTILAVCGATVLASGGSIFLTDTGLSLIDKGQQTVQSTEPATEEKETEQPLSVQTFQSTDDSFVIAMKKTDEDGEPETEAESETEEDTEKETEKNNTQKKETERETEKETDAPAAVIPNPEIPVTGGPVMYADGNANVRDMAGGDESQVIGTIPAGEAVSVTGNVVGNWVEVTYDGRTGYVYQDLLYEDEKSGSGTSSGSGSFGGSSSGNSSSGGSSTGSSSSGGSSGGTSQGGYDGNDTPSYYVESASGTMYATADVNVRGTASKYGEWLGGVSKGESVTVTGYADNGWTQISYGGQSGYVSSNYLSWDAPSSSGGSSSDAWDDSYYMYDSNSRYLSEDELDGWSASDLAILRNEIFARHGRIFSSSYYSDYFSQKTWYEPKYDPSYFDENMDSFLNDYEWANLDLIQKLEDERS